MGEGVSFAPGKWDEGTVLANEGTSPCAAADRFRQMNLQAKRLAAVHECLASGGCGVAAIPQVEGRPHCQKYTPLLKRAACPSLEEKQRAFEAKKRRKSELGEPAVAAAADENGEE